MKDVTDLVVHWFKCSNDTWSRWFADREDGADEYISIESAMLVSLVIDKLRASRSGLSRDTGDRLFESLRVSYVRSVDDHRVLCREQKGGNVYGESVKVEIPEGSLHRIKSLDSMGTMLDGVPYVELIYDDGFILEPFENLKYQLVD